MLRVLRSRVGGVRSIPTYNALGLGGVYASDEALHFEVLELEGGFLIVLHGNVEKTGNECLLA